MEIILLPAAEEDIKFWKKTGNKLIQNKISELIESILMDPFRGIGKPEPLKHQLAGCWSRRINKEHRLVYEIWEDKLILHSLRGHY